MSNSIQEPWKLLESKRIIDDWLRSCETDSSTTNLFEVPSPSFRPQKQTQHYKAALDEILRLRPRSQSLPTNFMDNSDQRARSGQGGERGVTTRSQGRKNRLNGSADEKTTSPTKLPTKRLGQSSKTYQYAQIDTTSDDPDLVDNVNIDQLQLEECLSATTSEFDLRTPTTLSRSTTFTAATKLTSASRNYKLRSRSPTKRIGDLRAAKPPIKVEAAIKVPRDVKVLRNRFMDIQDGIGVLPRCLQDRLNALDDREYRDIFFDRSAHPDDFDNSNSKATAHARELLEKLLSIRDAALRCQDLGKPEPSWMEEVFRPLLDLAAELENRDNDQKVQVENVTATQIFPKSLVPIGLQDLPFESKRVDYCIYLSQSKKQEARTRDILASRNVDIYDHSINQAGSADYVKWLPQLAAVECKKTIPGTDGMIQLGIWMAALRKRLEGLTRQDKTGSEKQVYIKPMPCLKVEGLDLKMYWCFIGEEGETTLYGPENFSLTKEMKGMYQTLNALREVVKYGRDEYWPWFQEAMLWED